MRSDDLQKVEHWSALTIKSQKVLLVDQNDRDLHYYRLILESQGYDVVSCPSFEAGAQRLESESFDFIMIDQGTSAFEGKKLVERALQLNPPRAVLVTAAYADESCHLDAMQIGAVAYMQKPLAPSVFLPLVRAHVRRDGTRLPEAGSSDT